MPQVEALPPAWVPVDGRPAGYNAIFTQIACGGPADTSVWAVDNRRNVYVRKGISENMPIGVDWESVEGRLCTVLKGLFKYNMDNNYKLFNIVAFKNPKEISLTSPSFNFVECKDHHCFPLISPGIAVLKQ